MNKTLKKINTGKNAPRTGRGTFVSERDSSQGDGLNECLPSIIGKTIPRCGLYPFGPRGLVEHRHPDVVLETGDDGLRVAGVRVADDAGGRVVREHADGSLEAGRVGRDHEALTGMDGQADAHAAAVVHAGPGGPARDGDERVQDGPVRDCIAAVHHALGLTSGGRDRAAVEVVAADPDRGGDATVADRAPDQLHGAGAFAHAEPAHACGESGLLVEVDEALGHLDPVAQQLVVAELVEDDLVDHRDVGGVAGERDHAERSATLAEERTHVQGNEPLDVECVFHALLLGVEPDAVAVVEGRGTAGLECQHQSYVDCCGLLAETDVALGIVLAHGHGLVERELLREVAAVQVVRRGLVGQDVRSHVVQVHVVQHVDHVGVDRDGDGLVAVACLDHAQHRILDAGEGLVDPAFSLTASDLAGVHLRDQDRGTGHLAGRGLSPAHVAETGREQELAGAGACPHEGLVGALHDALLADERPGTGGHLAVHHGLSLLERPEVLVRGPAGDQHGVRDQGARGVLVGVEDSHGLAALDEHGLVGLHAVQGAHDRIERLPAPRGTSASSVDDELLGLGALSQVVEDHAQHGFDLPVCA